MQGVVGWGHQCEGVAGVGSPMKGGGRGGVTNARGGRVGSPMRGVVGVGSLMRGSGHGGVTNARGGLTNARGWLGWGHQFEGVAGVGSPMQGVVGVGSSM